MGRSEALKRAQKRYAEKNKEKLREYHDNWQKQDYAKHPKKYRLWANALYEKNKEKINERRKKDYPKAYLKHKKKWKCRNATYQLLKREPNIIHPRQCKRCKSNRKLQIHHEVYHPHVKEIREDIAAGLIYYLCFKCHHYKY